MTEDRRKPGRRPVEIDFTELEKLCALQCTDEEIADWFGVSTRTIENRRKRPEFAQVMKRGRSRGRISVRRSQMKLLEDGNGTMGVWLVATHPKQLPGRYLASPIPSNGVLIVQREGKALPRFGLLVKIAYCIWLA